MTSATNPAIETFVPTNLASVIPLFQEIGNLKRVRPPANQSIFDKGKGAS